MAVAAERAAEIAGERAHVGALAAIGLEGRLLAVMADELEPVDDDLARGDLELRAVAGEIVGALAGDPDGRELVGGVCQMMPMKPGSAAAIGSPPARSSDCATDSALGVVGVGFDAPSHENR